LIWGVLEGKSQKVEKMEKVKVGLVAKTAMEPLEPEKLAGGGLSFDGFLGSNVGSVDDRVLCEDCAFFGAKTVVQRFTSDQFDKIRKINHPAFRWMFDSMIIQDDWRVVKYQEKVCKKNSTMILSVKHRCYLFEPKVEVGLSWLDESTQSNRTYGTSQAGDVAEGVLPRPDSGSDTQWWD